MSKRDKKPRKSRWRRVLFWGLVLLVLAVGFAPTIVLNSPLLSSTLARALPEEAGLLTAHGAAGGWLTPLALRGVELHDAAGNPIFKAEKLEINHSLAKILTSSEPLKVWVVRPVAHLFVRPDGSNIEDLLATLKKHKDQDSEGEEEPSPLGDRDLQVIVISDATLYVTDTTSDGRWTHQQITVDIDLSGGLSKLDIKGRLGAALPQFEQLTTDPVTANFQLKIEPSQGAARHVALNIQNAPINAVDPFARRVDPTMQLAGLATGQGVVTWNAPQRPGGDWAQSLVASGLQSEGNLAVTQFTAQGQSLGGDTLRLERIEAPWRVRTDGARLVIEDLNATSEVGSVKLLTALSPDDLRGLATGQGLATARGQWPLGRLEADLDVAKFAQLAPAAVALRSDVRPLSGRVALLLETQPPTGARLTGHVTASNFTAEVAGAQVAWEQPFTLSGAVARQPVGLLIESLQCKSEFLTGNLQGDRTNLRGHVQFDLDKLASQLGQYVDLREWRLAGRGNADVRIEQPALGQRSGTVVAHLADVMVARGDAVYLQEPELKASLTALAATDQATGAVDTIHSARLAVESGDDNLEGSLTEPFQVDSQDAVQFDATLKGQLTSWQNRLRVALAPLGGLALLNSHQFAGQIDATATARVGSGVLRFWDVKVEGKEVRVTGGSLALREPKVLLTGDFAWNAQQQLIASQAGELVTSTISMRSEEVNASLAAGQAAASGRVAVAANLAQLNRWFAASERPLPTGFVEGSVFLSQQQNRLHAKLNITGQNITLLDAETQAPLLQEPQLSVVADATYATDAGQLVINSATVTSDTLKVQANGGAQNGAAQLSGTADYDLTAWAPAIKGYLGPEVTVSGRHQASFNLSRAAPTDQPAPWSRAWSGRAVAPWTSINVFGLPIGPGQFGVTLADGELKADPLSLAVSGGAINAQLGVRLDPAPAMWGAAPGQVLTDVEVTPEISDRMLKYIAPVLADATRSQGVFSLKVTGASGPLSPLKQLTVQGQLDAQNVLVTPGPATIEWVQLAQQIEALVKQGEASVLLGGPAAETKLLVIGQKTINFTVKDGLVHHEGLEFQIGEVTVRSSGTVGLDETLDIVLTIPVKDAWLDGRPMLAGLQGKELKIPIRGTFGDQKIDQRELKQMSRSLLRDGVRGAIGGALQKLLGD